MKKLFLFFLMVLLLVTLCVPVFASEIMDVTYRNKLLDTTLRRVDITWTTSGNNSTLTGDYIELKSFGDRYELKFGPGNTCITYEHDGSISSGQSYLSYFDTIILDNTDDDFQWLIDNWFLLLVCDGSSCPSTDVNKDNVCDDCGMPFSVPRDYSPFTVKKFMNHISQIFSSAVSWVGNVGAAILAQPLLLAFTALPLCGLGIAVFRRMKETV